jgi:hypothetical protein
VIDRHLLAAISLGGTLLDLIGSLYLAYDLLGGKKGPLRVITRIATYSVIFGLGYALPLGLRYGLVAGPGFGVALGLEFWLASGRPKSSHPSIPRTTIPFAVLRGSVLGAAAGWTFDVRFGVWFGVFAAIALIAAYGLRFSPSEEYAPNVRPQLTRRKVVATCVRGLMIGLAGALAGALAHERGIGLLFGLEIGLVVAVVGGIVATVSPFIEWWADNLPERRLGFFGAMLVLAGFGLQSLQYWAVLLNAPVG